MCPTSWCGMPPGVAPGWLGLCAIPGAMGWPGGAPGCCGMAPGCGEKPPGGILVIISGEADYPPCGNRRAILHVIACEAGWAAGGSSQRMAVCWGSDGERAGRSRTEQWRAIVIVGSESGRNRPNNGTIRTENGGSAAGLQKERCAITMISGWAAVGARSASRCEVAGGVRLRGWGNWLARNERDERDWGGSGCSREKLLLSLPFHPSDPAPNLKTRSPLTSFCPWLKNSIQPPREMRL